MTSPIPGDTSIICRRCYKTVGGVYGGDRMEWTTCAACAAIPPLIGNATPKGLKPLEWLTDAAGVPIPGTHNDRDYPRADGCTCASTDDHHTVECYTGQPAAPPTGEPANG